MRIMTVSAFFILTCCASIVPQTVARLHAVSPLEADPAGFRAAIQVPEGVNIPEGGARLKVDATRSDTSEVAEGLFVMAQTASDSALMFQIAEGDLGRLRALQTKILIWEENYGDVTTGSLSVDLTVCTTGNGPASDATFSVFLAVNEDDPLRPLTKDGLVRDILGSFGATSRCQ